MTPAATTSAVVNGVPYPNRVKQRRRALGLSTRIVSERSGIKLPTLFKLERGNLPLTVERAEALSAALECALADLRAPDDTDPLPTEADTRSRRGKGRPLPKTPEQQDEADLEALLGVVLSIPRRKRRIAVDVLKALKRGWSTEG